MKNSLSSLDLSQTSYQTHQQGVFSSSITSSPLELTNKEKFRCARKVPPGGKQPL